MNKKLNITNKGYILLKSMKNNPIPQSIQNKIKLQIDNLGLNNNRKEKLKRKAQHEILQNKVEEVTIRRTNCGQLELQDCGDDARIPAEAVSANKKQRLESDENLEQKKGKNRSKNLDCNTALVHQEDPHLQFPSDTDPDRRKFAQIVHGDVSTKSGQEEGEVTGKDIHDQVIPSGNQPVQMAEESGPDMEKTRKIDLETLNISFTIKAVTQEELEQAEQQIRSRAIENNVLIMYRIMYTRLTLPQALFILRVLKEGRIKVDNAEMVLSFHRHLCRLLVEAELRDKVATDTNKTLQIVVQSVDGFTVNMRIGKWQTVSNLLQRATEAMNITGKAKLQLNGRFLHDTKLLCEEGLTNNQVVTIRSISSPKSKRGKRNQQVNRSIEVSNVP